jgi:hypothetical protein
MAKTLEDCIAETYAVGDIIPLTRGREGVIREVLMDENGKITELVVSDDKGKRSTVPMQTKNDVHRNKK